MPRKVRDSSLEARAARHRLRTRHKPYFRLIEPGLHLGYRKLTSGPGTWIVRRYVGAGRYTVENLRTANGELVLADDYADADGERVLSFAQAQWKARPQRRGPGGYTVADAMDDYLLFLKSDGRSEHAIRDARYRDQAFIRADLGNLKLAALTGDRLRRWRDTLVSTAPRLRTRKGEGQNFRELSDGDEDARRARRASANRTWTTLRAALNHAFREHKVEADFAWRAVKPFGGVDKARVRYLEVAESRHLANGTEIEFRPMVQAALLTGGRYGQLARLVAGDFNRAAGTVRMSTRKGNGTEKVYHVHLTDEGVRFFKQACLDRNAKDLIFHKADGAAWQKSDQARPMREASERAKISPPVNFHCLRHTYASHAVMNGAPLLVVAKNLGHSDTRMVERVYGHFSASYVADAIRAAVPKFGIVKTSNVTAIR
jgi:integrase